MNPALKYKVKLECDWYQAQDWCAEYVGEFDVDWYKLGVDPGASLFGDKTTTWYFADEDKMLMFVLRWS